MGVAAVEQGFFFPYFPSLKPRSALWSSASYSPKNTVSFSSKSLGFYQGTSLKIYFGSSVDGGLLH